MKLSLWSVDVVFMYRVFSSSCKKGHTGLLL